MVAIKVKAFLIAWLLLLYGMTPPAVAQQEVDSETFNNMIARWNTTLDFPEMLLTDPEMSAENLELLTENVQLVQELARNAEKEAQRNLKRQQNLLDALGPAPGEGDPEEPEEIAVKRSMVEEQVAIYSARVKQSRIVVARSKELIDRISDMEIKIITGLLTKRSKSPLSPQVFAEGIKMIPHRFAELGRSLKK